MNIEYIKALFDMWAYINIPWGIQAGPFFLISENRKDVDGDYVEKYQKWIETAKELGFELVSEGPIGKEVDEKKEK